MIIHELLIRPDPTPLADLTVRNRVSRLASADIFILAQATPTSELIPAGEYLEEHYHTGDIHTALATLTDALGNHSDHHTYDLTPYLHNPTSVLPSPLLNGDEPLTDFSEICEALRSLSRQERKTLLSQLRPVNPDQRSPEYGLPLP